MTNRLALALAAAVVAAVALDQAALDGSASLFLARKLAELVDYIAFWR